MEDQNTAAGGRKMFATVVLEAPIQRAGRPRCSSTPSATMKSTKLAL